MTTENHDYNTPKEGTPDWNSPLNNNFEMLDKDIEIRDIESNLGDYIPNKRAKFFAIDTGRRFLGDGSTWIEAPPQPLTQLNIPSTTEDPSDTVPGEMWYREDTNTLKVQLTNKIQSLATGSADGSDDSTDTESGNNSDDSTHTLEFVAADGAEWDWYTAVIDGEVIDTFDMELDGGDSVTQRDDGTVLVEGGLGNGSIEGFTFTGELIELSLDFDGTAYLDGDTVDLADYS